MRKVILIIVLLLVVIGGGLVIAVLTVDVNQFRPLVVTQLQALTGRQVELAGLRRSWTGGFGLELTGLVMHEDPRFGIEPCLSVARASATLRLAPLLKRRLELAAITLDHPTIRIVKNAAGQLNIQTPTTQPAASSQQPARTSTTALPFLISSLKVRSATVSFRDQSAAPPLRATLTDADMTVSDLRIVDGAPQATLQLRNGVLALSPLSRPMDGIAAEARLTPTQLTLTKLSALIGNGTLEATGTVEDARRQPQLAGEVTIHRLLVQDLLPATVATDGQHLEGQLSGQAALRGVGKSWLELQPTLQGHADLRLAEGRITNLNILREALAKLSMLPGVVERLETKLSAHDRQLLEQRDTVLRDVRVTARIEQGTVLLNPLHVTTEMGTLQGQGRIGFDRRVDIQVMIVLSPDLSQAIVSAVKELAALTDPSGAITFPIVVTGVTPHLAVLPDLNYIAQRVITVKGEELIGHLLEKALGGRQETGSPTTQAPATQEPSASDSDAQAAEALLRTLLKKKTKHP